MLPKTKMEVTLPRMNKYTPKAFLLEKPVVLLIVLIPFSNSGAIASATEKRKGRTKF